MKNLNNTPRESKKIFAAKWGTISGLGLLFLLGMINKFLGVPVQPEAFTWVAAGIAGLWPIVAGGQSLADSAGAWRSQKSPPEVVP